MEITWLSSSSSVVCPWLPKHIFWTENGYKSGFYDRAIRRFKSRNTQYFSFQDNFTHCFLLREDSLCTIIKILLYNGMEGGGVSCIDQYCSCYQVHYLKITRLSTISLCIALGEINFSHLEIVLSWDNKHVRGMGRGGKLRRKLK